MSHIRLYDQPARALAFSSRPPLTLTGALPPAKPGIAYEGRLQIGNPIGDCTAALISGALPPGSSVSVDNATQEVVVSWPAYIAGGTYPILNSEADFGLIGWEAGAGWSAGYDDDPSTRFVYANHGGTSQITSTSIAPVAAGQSVTASAFVRHGKSSRGNAGAQVRLEFLDASKAFVSGHDGNMIDGSSGGHDTTVIGSAPVAGFARVAGKAFRKRQNHAIYMDAFSWNVPSEEVGINVETTIGPITIRVTDSAGRTADWTGTIIVTAKEDMFAASQYRLDLGGSVYISTAGAAFDAGNTITPPNPGGNATIVGMWHLNGKLFACVEVFFGSIYMYRRDGGTWSVLRTLPKKIHEMYYASGRLWWALEGANPCVIYSSTDMGTGQATHTIGAFDGHVVGLTFNGSSIVAMVNRGDFMAYQSTNLAASWGLAWDSGNGSQQGGTCDTGTYIVTYGVDVGNGVRRCLIATPGSWSPVPASVSAAGATYRASMQRHVPSGRVLVLFNNGKTMYSDDSFTTSANGADVPGYTGWSGGGNNNGTLFVNDTGFFVADKGPNPNGDVWFSPDGVTPWVNVGTGLREPAFLAGARTW